MTVGVADPNLQDALALSRAIQARELSCRELSCRELMLATLAGIQRLTPHFNAIVNLAPDEVLLRQADAGDAESARGQWQGWMHGPPQAITDTAHATGFATTWGCALLKEAVASVDSLYVARMKAAGCIVIGKTNMPDFGLCAHSDNALFGTTGNAWVATRSAGGSSDGAAVALAQRMLPVADGSDCMGSLRNPAGWNNVYGLRPSAGRVPSWPRPELWVSPQLGTNGPMARTAADLAALLRTQAGQDPRVPPSLDGTLPADTAPAALRGLRIGWLGDLRGHPAREDGILTVCEAALARLAAAGAIVEPIAPGFDPTAVWETWRVWRRALIAPSAAAVLGQPGAHERITPEAPREYDSAQRLSFAEFMRASTVRSTFHAQWLQPYERFDVLALPVAQARPFSTAGRLPMGLQLIAAPRADARRLQIAAGYAALIGDLLARRPPEPRSER